MIETTHRYNNNLVQVTIDYDTAMLIQSCSTVLYKIHRVDPRILKLERNNQHKFFQPRNRSFRALNASEDHYVCNSTIVTEMLA